MNINHTIIKESRAKHALYIICHYQFKIFTESSGETQVVELPMLFYWLVNSHIYARNFVHMQQSKL